jgi:hypothetical protein
VGLTWKKRAPGYQALINDVLRRHVEGQAPKFEETLRRIVRAVLRWGNFSGKNNGSLRVCT